MAEERLKLTAQESLYPPVKVEVEGVVYTQKKMTRPVNEKLAEIEKRMGEADRDDKLPFIYEWVEFMFGIPSKILDTLDIREVEDINVRAKKDFQKTTQARMAELYQAFQDKKTAKNPELKIPSAKNRKRPGGKK